MRCAWVGLAVAFPLAEAASQTSVKLTARYSSSSCDGPPTFVQVTDASACVVSMCSKSATGTTTSTVCHSGKDYYSTVNDLFGHTSFILRESYGDANCSTFRNAYAITVDADCVQNEATGMFVRSQIRTDGSISVQYFVDSSCTRSHSRHPDYVSKSTVAEHSCDPNALKWYVARPNHRFLSRMEAAIRLISEEGDDSSNTDTTGTEAPAAASSATTDNGSGTEPTTDAENASSSDTTTTASSKSSDTAPSSENDASKSSDKGSNNAEPSPAPTPTEKTESPTTAPTPTTASPATTTPPVTTSAPAPTQKTHAPTSVPKAKAVSSAASASSTSGASASAAPSTTDTTTVAKKTASTDTSASGSSSAAPVSAGNSNASTFTLLGFAAGIVAIAIIILALAVRRVRTEDKSDLTPAPATVRREVRDPYGMQTSPFQSERPTQRRYTKLMQKPYLQQDSGDEQSSEQQAIQNGSIQHQRSQHHLGAQQLSGNYSAPSNSTEMWKDEVILASRIPTDKLEVQELLSCGAFGEVYSGMYDRRRVAVKMLLPQMRLDVKQVNEFLAEAKRAATMTHPHIVSFVGVAWNSLFDACVVMEFMDGGDLRTLLSDYEATRHPVGFDNEKVTIAMHVCQALAYMHTLATPIIHRDLKSRNILLDQAMDAKLTDFGISREKLDHTMTAGIGTSLWIAPEVLMGNHYDEKADVYSFGVVLSELDTHRLPYTSASEGSQMTCAVMLQKVVSGTLQVEFSQQGSQTIAELGRTCTSVDPNKRPRAAEILYILQEVLSEELLECSL